MSEITKLYENAEIEQTQDITCGDCEFVNYPEENKPCNACTQYGIKHYPPFTAEKQLEITKFLLKKAVYYDVKDDKYWFYYEECESAGYKPFDEAIAHFINKLWKDLTSEEKQQVKGILE